MGRPAKAGVAATEVITVRVTPELLARIDEARNDLSRPDWVRLVLMSNVTRFDAGGDLSEHSVPTMDPDPALIDDAEGGRGGKKRIAKAVAKADTETKHKLHRRGQQRTKALGNIAATWWCAEDGCTEILGDK